MISNIQKIMNQKSEIPTIYLEKKTMIQRIIIQRGDKKIMVGKSDTTI